MIDVRMFRRAAAWLCALALCLCALPLGVRAEEPEVRYGQSYCFSPSDFQVDSQEPVTGVFITGVPDAGLGKLVLGDRVIRQGDVLTAQQVGEMVFQPASRVTAKADVTFMPIYEHSVEKESTMTISIRGGDKTPPEVEDQKLETYKNLPREGVLAASDPEGSKVVFTIVRQPKRGELSLNADGSFTYTPKKNKVGKDSFTFTAADEAGNVSREGTVTVEILKPLDNAAYRDMAQSTHQFEALWMKNTGLFSGSEIAGERCFQPEAKVTRGEFLAMAMKLLELPVDPAAYTAGFADENEAADWLKPYLSAGLRAGVISGETKDGELVFRPNDTITQAEAAVMLQNALDLPASEADVSEDVPAWAQAAAEALAGSGVELTCDDAPLTREAAAAALYRVSGLLEQAPGLAALRSK